MRILVLLLSIVLTASYRDCQQHQGSDLVPVQTAAAFCKTDQARKTLFVTIKNQGNVDATASKTMVEFTRKQIFLGQTITLDTPAIQAGQSVEVAFPIPSGCFEPDCGFRITVDSSNQVTESNEGNNTAVGNCVG